MSDSLPAPGAGAPAPRVPRETLVSAITAFLADREPHALAEIRRSLEAEIDRAGPDALASFGERITTDAADWRYYDRDPLAHRLHHLLAGRILEHEPVVTGIGHVSTVAGRPTVVLANHLSYADANVVEVLLERAGGAALAERLTVIAGPKVYSNVQRRFSSLCFGTIRTPQSSDRSSEDAVMSPREVAVAARRVIRIAHQRLELGEALLIFPEGSRSRTGGMQPLLPGVARYLEFTGAVVLPVGLAGTEALFPIGGERLQSVPLAMHIGAPISLDALRAIAGADRRRIVDVLGLAIAAQLPPAYRGVYAESGPELDAARAVLGVINQQSSIDQPRIPDP